MKVLALECSTEQAGAALLSDGSLAASRPVETGRRRSQGLFDAVEALLRDAGWTWEDVEAIATGRGPGSY
ncbi:MAG TPA: tRNA (adenosine(37)-N6)-threonylcarbamoyltransferase complex dimerization subunit type 1 TsaB, partial [Kiritimatiellia bacterium]|nr:tRNA (adenosine(37)-N6)-threonylcarbamoyltransferase complex dimerization subunit type 1 TsaB [Kiritimatiellia bacterium]